MVSKFDGINSDTVTQCALAYHMYIKQEKSTNMAHSLLKILS